MAIIYTSFEALPLFLSIEQLKAVLGVGRNTAYEMVRSGQIKSFRCNGQYRIPKTAIQDLMQQKFD